MMRNLLFSFAMLLTLSAAAESIRWNAENNFGNWGKPIRLKLERKDGLLRFNSTRHDPIFSLNQKLDLKDCKYFEIVYRTAGKITKGNWSLLYFQTDTDEKFSEKHRINLGRLNDNGQWQTKRVKLDEKTVCGWEDWQKADHIKALRVDLIDDQGEVEIRSMAFLSEAEKVSAGLLEGVNNGYFAAFSGKYEVSSESPAEGKFCMVQGDGSDKESIAMLNGVIPVKPSTRYRLKVAARNNIPLGHVIFGFGQSRSAEKFKITNSSEWGWTQLACNIPEWKNCVMDLTTFPTTRGLRIYFKVRNFGTGKAWWDKLELVEVNDKTPEIAMKPFLLRTSFTDIPTMLGRRNAKSGNMEWVELKPETTPLQLECNAYVPQNAVVKVSVFRAGKKVFEQTRKASEKLDFVLPLAKWQAGKYQLKVIAELNGKKLCSLEKFLWRQQSFPEKKLVSVREISTLPGRRFAINGEPFFSVYYSHFPAMHIRPDFTEYPNAVKILKTARQQLCLNTLGIISYGKAPSLQLPREEYLPKAIAYYTEQYLKQLDFCKANNLYGSASLHMGSSLRPRGMIDYELIQGVVRNIKHHPALIGYGYDEPDARKVITPEMIVKMHQTVKTEDPAHPVCVNLCQRLKFKQYLQGSDIASFDNYPFPYSDLHTWREYSQAILAAKKGIPFRTYLQAFQYPDAAVPRHEDIYAEFILSLIEGSRSLVVYSWNEGAKSRSHCLVTDPEMQATARLAAEQGNRLSEFLFKAKTVPVSLKASPNIVYKYYQGEKYDLLLAVNLSGIEPASIQLSFPGKKNLSDAMDPAWTWKPDETVTLKPNQTLTVRVR